MGSASDRPRGVRGNTSPSPPEGPRQAENVVSRTLLALRRKQWAQILFRTANFIASHLSFRLRRIIMLATKTVDTARRIRHIARRAPVPVFSAACALAHGCTPRLKRCLKRCRWVSVIKAEQGRLVMIAVFLGTIGLPGRDIYLCRCFYSC